MKSAIESIREFGERLLVPARPLGLALNDPELLRKPSIFTIAELIDEGLNDLASEHNLAAMWLMNNDLQEPYIRISPRGRQSIKEFCLNIKRLSAQLAREDDGAYRGWGWEIQELTTNPARAELKQAIIAALQNISQETIFEIFD